MENSVHKGLSELVDPAIDVLKRVLSDDQVKLAHRLKAAGEVLARTCPTVKSIEHRMTTPITLQFVSANEDAKKVLSEEGKDTLS